MGTMQSQLTKQKIAEKGGRQKYVPTDTPLNLPVSIPIKMSGCTRTQKRCLSLCHHGGGSNIVVACIIMV